MRGVNKCPNPDCEGGVESLKVKVDGKCSGGYFGWIHCVLCGMSGPTQRNERDAISSWNKMTSNVAKSLDDLEYDHRSIEYVNGGTIK